MLLTHFKEIISFYFKEIISFYLAIKTEIKVHF